MEQSIHNKVLILLISLALLILFTTWGTGWITFFCFLVIGYCALMMWLNQACQREAQLVTTLSADVVEQVIRKQFSGLAWKLTDDPEDLNWKHRLSGLTISLNIDKDAPTDGSLTVTIYMSRWSTKYGVVSGAEQVVRQQRKIVKKLQNAQDRTLEART
jgi:hypothetical protein